ncbi:MAG: pantetheine-phosphate adenylyltransferase [Candidatus Aureabacteria bacterium]|nr:pantetheine-phosphate adenylyltransferase [Candidatus Auribacterota bacterium]
MMKGPVIYAGSFDPVTYGHLDLVHRAARIFPRVIVAVARNLEKRPFFTVSQRADFLRQSLRDLPAAEVDSFSGLLVDYAVRRGVRLLLRGLRAVSDFEYEFQMALTNRKLHPELETIYLMPCESFSYLSSRIIKEIAALGGDVSPFVPPAVVAAFRRRAKR